MNFSRLPMRNLARRPGRTAALVLLTSLLAFALAGGALVISSLRNGMKSLEGRLGADIIVVPSTMKSKVNLDNILLMGTTGYYYMKDEIMDKVAEIDGVEKAAPQIFLASLKASCCSMPVQVIGYDPELDFTVQPWVQESYGKDLETYDVIVGCKVNAGPGEQIRIYECNCNVVGRLARTGTDMDTAVYTTRETMALLLQAARDLGHDLKITGDSADYITAVYVKVRDDADVEAVTNDINLHIRKVEAVRTKSMLTDVSDGMAGVSGVLTWLVAAIWILVFLLIMVAFVMILRERKKEFATLRMLGASTGMLSGMIFRETSMVCLAGCVAGTAMALLVVLPFSTLIETSLGLPFLLPSAGTTAALCAAMAAGVWLTGTLASLWAVWKLGHVDASTVLRSEN